MYDSSVNPPIIVAGCRQWGNMTTEDFFLCLGFCFEEPIAGQFWLADASSNIVTSDNTILQPGEYHIISTGSSPLIFVDVNENRRTNYISSCAIDSGGASSTYPLLHRQSHISSELLFFLCQICQTQNFRHRVQARDRVCMISGHDLSFANFIGQNVCHIIPRSHSEFASPSVLLLMIF